MVRCTPIHPTRPTTASLVAVVALAAILALVLVSTGARAQGGTWFQEDQCARAGWRPAEVEAAGLRRRLLWRGPGGPWTQGALLVLHGGGGHHFQYCVANAAIVEPQVRFAEAAVAAGFGVLLLESSDRVTDREGRACGKVWDDEVRDRPNLDLPFLAAVIGTVVPGLRPAGSRRAVFLAGHSSGGYMTVRTATHFGDRIAAFAPVASGDPYGWHRVCVAGMTRRTTVHGAGFDNETLKRIDEPDACAAPAYPNGKPWDDAGSARKPAFRAFRHRQDAINDVSCSRKVEAQLRTRGYPAAPSFELDDNDRRSFANHLWLDAYTRPLLEFFAERRHDRP